MSIKTKFIDVDVQKIHDNINRRDAETISDIVYDALNELGYIDDDNLMSWSWNIEASVEVKE
jgi:Holliday junction resolvase RusA-like endonuclease